MERPAVSSRPLFSSLLLPGYGLGVGVTRRTDTAVSLLMTKLSCPQAPLTVLKPPSL